MSTELLWDNKQKMAEIDRNLELLVAAYERLQFLEQENEHLRQKYHNASRVIAQMARTIDDLTGATTNHSHQQTPPNHQPQSAITTPSNNKWAETIFKHQETTTSKFMKSQTSKEVINTLMAEMEETLEKREKKVRSIQKHGVLGNKENEYEFRKQLKMYRDVVQKVEQRQSLEHQKRKMTPGKESQAGSRMGRHRGDRLVL